MAQSPASPSRERLKFVKAYLKGGQTFTALCAEFGISRQNGYKWVRRYEEGGVAALEDRSSRPLTSPAAIAPWLVDLVVELRRAHPDWGPRKILAALGRQYAPGELPAVSTVGAILRSRGLVTRRAGRPPSPGDELGGCEAPNEVWCVDFEGHLVVGGRRCTPLVLYDGFSRLLLRAVAMRHGLHEPVQAILEDAFREHGLPDAIRTHDRPPFVSMGTGGLSRLAVWWIRLGIEPQRVMRGRSRQRGLDERIRRALLAETARPARRTFPAKQRAFDAFREAFNHRPHAALGGATPTERYRRSRRQFTGTLRDPQYPRHFEVVRAYPNGVISFERTQWYLSVALASQRIGIEPIADGRWRVYFGPVALGLIDQRRAVRRSYRNFGLLTRLPPEPRSGKPVRKR